MKRLILTSLFVVTAFITVPVLGGITSFDENGTGTYIDNVGTLTTLTWNTGTTANDPGITTLYYNLPFGVIEGDLQVMEPGSTAISDVLRFINNTVPGSSRVYVYSDSEPGAPDGDIADTAIPTPWMPTGTPPLQVYEIGPEGNNGVSYAPGFTDPGTTSAPMTYNFTSDVPEPATIIMLALGGLVIGRKRKVSIR